MSESLPETASRDVFSYHQRTKHRFEAYARGPGTLDWEAQPNPFRHFNGAPQIPLPLVANSFTSIFSDVVCGIISAPQPLNLTTIAGLLEISLALSAWKVYGESRWSMRCNPSSGNLHPTEAYVITQGVSDLPSGVYHYCADAHLLERRCLMSSDSASASRIWLGLSSIHWREAWKYGERAFRYCQLDIGHALAALNYAAATLGWSLRLCSEISDGQLKQLLGLDRAADFTGAEAEQAEILLEIIAAPLQNYSACDLVASALSGAWQGSASIIDARHFYHWPIIDEVAAQCEKPAFWQQQKKSPEALPPLGTTTSLLPETASQLLRQRRSAQAFTAKDYLEAADFYWLLDSLLPRPGIAPWETVGASANTHLLIFVHRVNGLLPGLYLLARDETAKTELQQQMKAEFLWHKAQMAPEHMGFYQLVVGNAQKIAAQIGCHQAIASDGAFCVAMLSRFNSILQESPWQYGQLFWEPGTIGQALYLGAEALGWRGTGIGCFFDDPLHSLLGLTGDDWQCLYMFTCGVPLRDTRIISLPPYSAQS